MDVDLDDEGGRYAAREAIAAVLAPWFAARTLDEVRAALQAMPGISTVRMGGPTTPMTKDYRIDRATGLIENGVVTRITCG
jgi:hypothetical protein